VVGQVGLQVWKGGLCMRAKYVKCVERTFPGKIFNFN
jgi:hypothetical protein